MDYIHAYSAQQVTYKGTQRWIYDPLVMVEEYQAGDFDYRVNIENGLIVEDCADARQRLREYQYAGMETSRRQSKS